DVCSSDLGPGDVAVRTGRPLDGCETPGRVDGPVTGRDRGRPSVGRRQGLRPEVERATRRRLRSAVASYVDGELRDGETVRAGRARLAGVALRTLRPNRATERRRHAAGLAYWLPFRNADVLVDGAHPVVPRHLTIRALEEGARAAAIDPHGVRAIVVDRLVELDVVVPGRGRQGPLEEHASAVGRSHGQIRRCRNLFVFGQPRPSPRRQMHDVVRGGPVLRGRVTAE